MTLKAKNAWAILPLSVQGAAVALILTACSFDAGKLTNTGKKHKADKDPDASATSTATKTGDSEQNDSTGSDTGANNGANDGETNGETDDDGAAAANAAIEAMVKDCGGTEVQNAGPNDVVYEKNVTSLPITTNVLLVKVTATTKLNLKVTGATTEQTSAVTIDKILPEALAMLAKGPADLEAKANSGKVTMTNVPFTEYASLSKHKPWNGIICTFVPATKVENGRGGHKTVATFDPPMPLSISPRAVKERYDAEIGESHTFKNMQVKIDSSDDPALAGKKTVRGSITVERVSPETQVDDGKGGKQTIKAGIAYKLTYDFESPAVTFALGLPPEATFYVDLDRHEIAATVVDTKSQTGGRAVFIYD